jgi:Mor family transcriptional regulator
MSQQGDLLSNDPNEAACQIAIASDEDIPSWLWPQQLADMVDVLVAHLRRQGRPPEEALTDAREIVLVIAGYMGGHRIYLPTGDALKVGLRDTAIYQQHVGGKSFEDLSYIHGLSVRSIERIVARQAAFRYRRRQYPLFPDLEPNQDW